MIGSCVDTSKRTVAIGGSTIAAVRFAFLFAFLVSSFVPLARAQGGFTTVTGTITDPNGLKYACGTISAQLVTAGGASPTLNGGGFTTQTSPIALGCPTSPGSGAPGSFAMRLADSGVINPSNTTWRFTVNMSPGIAPPAGTGPQSFTVTTAINCGTNTPATCTSNVIDISTLLSASAPALSNTSGSGTGFPVTTPVTVGSGGSINISGSGSINGIVAGQTPILKSINVADPKYGAKFDGKVFFANVNTCSFTSGLATFTCTGAGLSAADVGKQLSATIGSCCGVQFNFVGTAATPVATSTTILSVQDATHATASQNFIASSGANWIIWWATNDDAAITAAETDWAGANKCQGLVIPAGITALLQPHFNNPGTNCLGAEPQADYTAQVSGQGIGVSMFGIATGFNFAGCPITGANNGGCFFNYLESTVKDLQFNGFGWGNTGLASPRNLLAGQLGSQWTQVACMATGGSDTNLTGINMGIGFRGWGAPIIDGCGNVGGQVNGSIVKFYYAFFGDTNGPNLGVPLGADLTDFGSDYGGAGLTVILSISGRYHGIGSNLFTCNTTNSSGILMGGAGALVILEGGRWNCLGATSNGIFMNVAGQKLILGVGTIVGGTLNAVSRTNAIVYTDPTVVFAAGSITTLAPGSCAESAGNGTCALVAGSTNEKGTVRITAGTTTATNPSFSYNFAGTYAGPSGAAPSCNYWIKNTGTGSWITAAPVGIGLPFPSAISTTAVTVNILTTVSTVSTSTYDVGYSCIAQ
jgi:hypothetical protein